MFEKQSMSTPKYDSIASILQELPFESFYENDETAYASQISPTIVCSQEPVISFDLLCRLPYDTLSMLLKLHLRCLDPGYLRFSTGRTCFMPPFAPLGAQL